MRRQSQKERDANENTLNVAPRRVCALVIVGDKGLEPLTFWV
jgi:hypothetical protein